MTSFKKKSFSQKTIPLFLVGIFGLIITIVVFFAFRTKELQEIRNDFHFSANNLSSDLKQKIDNDIDTLPLIKALFQGSEFVTRSEFQKFVQPILERHQHILLCGWIPFVNASEREELNRKIKEEGYGPLDNKKEKSGFLNNIEKVRDIYPVYYLEGKEKEKLRVGTDLADSTEVFQALRDSARTGTTGAVEIEWPYDGNNQKVYMVFLPVFGKNLLVERPVDDISKSLGGFIFGVFPITTILQKVQKLYGLSDTTIEILEHSTVPPEERMRRQVDHDSEILRNYENFKIGNQELIIQSQSLPNFIPSRLSWRPGAVLVAGILITGLLLLYLDRTFRRTAQIELLAEKLSVEVAERKRAAEAREKLVSELEAKNAELERFTYTVSHDLKSPLISIRGFSGLLAQDAQKGDNERVKADVRQINSATDKMQRLLDELLELSRIGRLVNPSRPIDLSDLIQETVDILTGRISEGKVKISFSPQLPVVYGDRPRLLEVFQNLIDNAVKFMGEQSSPCIEIFAEESDEHITCFVQDNGAGIPERYQEKIFGLFERLDQACEGTGIGLALVKRIVEFHGGRIWVESEGEGKGSTFVFNLPLGKEGSVDG